jgi:S-adenosylmethionine-diacylglycerol 3-amino-3-carboxypropyl transferase
MSVGEWLGGRMFRLVHQHNLVYNTCWEDPRLDRAALKLTPEDTVLVITSAGCNALDYALAGAGRVIAVDMNPRQNALLELKLAGCRRLRYEDFFEMFGRGRLDQAGKVYHDVLRSQLSPWSQNYWDRWIEFFEPGNRRPFYHRGTCGTIAMLVNAYLRHIVRLRSHVDAMLAATSIEEQRQIYDAIRDRFWTRSLRFAMRRNSTMYLLGVPLEQRCQVEADCEGDMAQFVQNCIDAVFGCLPLTDNYFWRVYLNGQYERACCPEYLKAENFERLKAGLASRVELHSQSVQEFLQEHDGPISRFVLLDHMDWLTGPRSSLLRQEWQWIVRRAATRARVIWRSGGLRTDAIDGLKISVNGGCRELGELLNYQRELADSLHAMCRVHTYASFHIADIAA